ncbi:hypothetical protein [Variovorax sp. GB1P17]|uniref:hypothetical protein n=1 Tax=Variovorax sp. GB1P17 TaxID=3443740 RepID=UPI003F475AD5
MTSPSLPPVADLLRYQAARLGLGTLDADTIKKTIVELMNGGFYVDECQDVLDAFPHPRMDEVLPAFKAALDHHGVALPNREAAVWLLIEYRALRMASEHFDAVEELSLLIEDVYYSYDFHAPAGGFLGDSHDIEKLIGIYWGSEALREGSGDSPLDGEALIALNCDIRAEARRWLAKHP